MGEIDLNSIQADNVVDARGVSCPGPLLKAKKGMGNVQVGEILEIMSNDPGSKNDIPRWAKKVGHDYIGSLDLDGADRFFIKRGK
ncbi:MAG: sulfurtransferase TusA family protein [Deltaproteobacteria bacterium]|jgi:TusA-related sulfurtransferase|nr:sulfurtransferase TusA family protein [Deltaproteobacteria bacterium]